MFVFPLIAALVAAAFALGCLRSFRAGASPALAVWGIALLQFAVASGALAWGAAFGWTPSLFRVYYLLGAVLNVPWLGLGTVWLLGGRGTSMGATVVAGAATILGVGVVATAGMLPGAQEALEARTVVGGASIFGEGVRNLSRVYSFAGLVVLVAGLVWSLVRRRAKAGGLGLLLAGAMVVFAVSVFARRGELAPFSVGLAVGVTAMYAGFLRTRGA